MRRLLPILLLAATAVAQYKGVPASITSVSPGNSAPGIPASVTSMQPLKSMDPHPRFVFPNSTYNANPNYYGPTYNTPNYNYPNHRNRGYVPGYPVYIVPYYTTMPVIIADRVPEPYVEPAPEPLPVIHRPPPPPEYEPEDSTRYGEHRFAEPTLRPIPAPAPAPPAAAIPADDSSEIIPPVVLIFRDGSRSEVVNYAITGDFLLVVVKHRSHRIPLSDLDLDATLKANQEAGIDFHLPKR